MTRILALVVACALLAGCATTFKSAAPDAAGHFPTTTKLTPKEVVTVTPFDPAFAKMLYVKTDTKSEKYNTFFVDSLKQATRYDKVVDKDQLQSMIIQMNIGDRVQNVSDLVGLNNLSKEIGPFLLIEPYAEWKGGYNFAGELKATDPRTGQVVFYVKKTAFNWSGLDQPLFFPLLNAFVDWSNGRQPETAEERKSAIAP
jgi:hypothetical protein